MKKSSGDTISRGHQAVKHGPSLVCACFENYVILKHSNTHSFAIGKAENISCLNIYEKIC